jgi:hypothetical protein
MLPHERAHCARRGTTQGDLRSVHLRGRLAGLASNRARGLAGNRGCAVRRGGTGRVVRRAAREPAPRPRAATRSARDCQRAAALAGRPRDRDLVVATTARRALPPARGPALRVLGAYFTLAVPVWTSIVPTVVGIAFALPVWTWGQNQLRRRSGWGWSPLLPTWGELLARGSASGTAR